MKKIISIALAATLAISMVGCSSGAASSSAGSTPQETTSQAASSQAMQAETVTADEPSTIQEQVIYDKNDMKITATALDQSGMFGPEVKMLIENNGAANRTVQTEYCSANGYMIESMMSCDVAAGKKANDGLTLMESDLTTCGVGKFTDITFNLVIIDSDSYERVDVSDLITLETSNTGKYEQTYNDAGTVLYEGNDIRIIGQGIDENELFGQGLLLYIENNSGATMTIQSDGVSVNGFMVDAMFSCDVLAGKKAVDSVTFMSSSLEENNIEKITDIEISFILIDTGSFNRIETTSPITITL